MHVLHGFCLPDSTKGRRYGVFASLSGYPFEEGFMHLMEPICLAALLSTTSCVQLATVIFVAVDDSRVSSPPLTVAVSFSIFKEDLQGFLFIGCFLELLHQPCTPHLKIWVIQVGSKCFRFVRVIMLMCYLLF